MNIITPLRYPGGKSKIYKKVANLINTLNYNDRIYVEPYGGGFGIGLQLIKDGIVQKAILNDYDTHIYHFWWCVFNKTNALIKKIENTPVTLEEREKQKKLYKNTKSVLNDAFATLYLNRVNFSGIIKGGPLGGADQQSRYKIDCRFGKQNLIKKIKMISEYKGQIEVYNYDAEYLISVILKDKKNKCFFNIDPPYVLNGKELYTCYYKEDEHIRLAKTVKKNLRSSNWIITYDDCELIRELYNNYTIKEFVIWHSAKRQSLKTELVITKINESLFEWQDY